MFHVSFIGHRLKDGVPFCTICHDESLQGGNYEVRKHTTTRNPQ